MTTVRKRGFDFWALQVPGWLLLFYLIYAQGITAFDYDIGVAMGHRSLLQLSPRSAQHFGMALPLETY